MCELKCIYNFLNVKKICHTLTGVWVEIISTNISCSITTVTPSRVCELKYKLDTVCYGGDKSHPHGCVSWNMRDEVNNDGWYESHPHGCVSWNRICWWRKYRSGVTPSRVCELKLYSLITMMILSVTPSRVCELKCRVFRHYRGYGGHTLTGVWVEILRKRQRLCLSGHTLTGVWVEIELVTVAAVAGSVTPSRVCELKLS